MLRGRHVVPDLRNLPNVFEGVVSKAPANVNALLEARSSYAGGVTFGPMPWPRDGTRLPAVGNRCLIIEPPNSATWCVAWWAG